ncbi:MAG TPA: M23 family metallopeptidase [Spirochaetota bacterium]|nr:M23 family metallopeptidase [Spirochaetota bacterium]
MYDFKRYTFPEKRKTNNIIYGFFSILFILIICIFTLIPNNANNNTKVTAASNLNSIENKLIIDGVKMEDDTPPAETEGEIIYDDNFVDDIDIDNIVTIEHNNITKDTKIEIKKDKSFDIDKLKKKDKRWHLSKYTIKKNDNLWKIAKKFNVNYALIIMVNKIDNPDLLKPGKIIMVPNKNGVLHQVKKGESLYVIAREYNVSPDRIIKHNELKNANMLLYGDDIFIPDAAEVIKKNNGDVLRDNKSIAKNNVTGNIKKSNNVKLSLLWPVEGKITSGFGTRRNPFGKGKQFHCGLDISCVQGTPVKAALNGTVIFSGWKDGYGNVIILRHDKGYITVYGHNSHNLVLEGDRVDKGHIIAKSGMTGSVTGAHLHFEIRKYLTPLNPLRYFKGN